MTEYIVLEFEGEGAWSQKSTHAARSAKAAVTAHLESAERVASALERKFVAVPLRSWSPVTVKVETKTALRFS